MRILTRIFELVSRLCLYLAAGAGALMALFVALSAVMRYVAGAPFRFTEEQVGLLFVAMVFLALPYCTFTGRDIRVTLISDRLPGSATKAARALSSILIMIFCVGFGLLALDFTALSYELKSLTDMAGITLYPWMAIMPLGCLLLGIAALLEFGGRTGAAPSANDQNTISGT
jgi:TRAP-type C4-dicarboxylate transport system permease small subunit